MDIPKQKKKGKYIPKKEYCKTNKKNLEQKLKKKYQKREFRKANRPKKIKKNLLYVISVKKLVANKCKMKNKINNLNTDEELKDSLKKLFLTNTDSEIDSSQESNIDSSTDLELENLSDISEGSESDNNKCCTSLKQEDSNDDIYKLISQFKDSNNINVLKNNDTLEFLKLIKDQELRSRIIETMDIPSSRANISVIQEGLIPTKYFEKTTHSLRHAGGEKLQINFKLPKAYICNNIVCIPESFLLVKNITNQVILGTPFLKNIFPITHISEKYLEGTYNNQKVSFQFITEPQTKILNKIKDVILRKFNQINFLTEEINTYSIEIDLKNLKLQDKIKRLQDHMSLEICNDHPNAFWDRKNTFPLIPPLSIGYDRVTAGPEFHAKRVPAPEIVKAVRYSGLQYPSSP
uniref:Uncharacterized protein n=1 Tax=Kalanchoe fedtschenkoi TaxID=63787 RepID=A0A7N0T614_KALFE